ncbi:DUF2071 domain-containing protein [bacterium]|nr:MAG: DUF2071 domain-containing protein [bacterium]
MNTTSSPSSSPGRIVMTPIWRHLLFLHWEFEPQVVQKLLPEGLEVDTFEGKAYVGLVPFTMGQVRPNFIPNMGRWGHFYEQFAELNVRTYVKRNGVPGVWFFSLDAASSPAVLTARAWFGLPYYRARMKFWRGNDGAFRYRSHRLWPVPPRASCSLQYRVEGEVKAAEPGSLEEFLVERYSLYSRKNGQWYRGRVHHTPYPLRSASVQVLREDCLAAAGFERMGAPQHVVYSAGVDVDISPLEVC